RNAYIGGADGVSVGESGRIIGREAMGTMPHALVLCMGSTLEALKAFDQVIEPDVPRVALIDTLQDEKFESINVAGELGSRLYAVRFDTPASRRGNFYRILEECRWELDLRGHSAVKFFLSGGIREEDVPVLNPLVAGYGIGTAISNAPVIDYAMDIMEVEGKPFSKVGKWSGGKRVLKCAACGARRIVPNRPAPAVRLACPCGSGDFTDVLVPVLDAGGTLLPAENADAIRQRTLANTANLPLA
ncbi:MAG: nicotinate phosphoribosyltransferase, partial [Nitrospiraceae bacterium]|nr:nicotinate phosphoribosyltransferase [Nitrospiraceae bacterium]